MAPRSRDLATQLEVFNERLIDFLHGLEPDKWDCLVPWEGFPVRAIASHIAGPRHYGLVEVVRQFLADGEVPQIDQGPVLTLANRDMAARTEASPIIVLDELRRSGAEAVRYIATLSDEQLEASHRFPRHSDPISVAQFIEWILIGSSVEHLENMKRAVSNADPG